MYKNIMVTLDGSRLAESALTYLAALTPRLGADEIVLFTVVEEVKGSERHIAEGYLRDRIAELKKTWESLDVKGPRVVAVTTMGLYGQVPGKILRYAEDNGIDLIVMTTHGRSGIDRWIMGSVADKVLRGADMPVLLVRSNGKKSPRPATIEKILVPLDGSEMAEGALPYAGQLASSGSGELVLLYVETAPGTDSRPLGHGKGFTTTKRHNEIVAYLDSIASGLEKSGINARPKIRVGNAAEEISTETEESNTDLIVMSSHGHTGLARWAYGSVADRVLHGASVPVLLARANVIGEVPDQLRGPLVFRCHNCGRRIHQEIVTAEDRCPRCGYFLRACANCMQYNSIGCLLRLPYASELYAGNKCPQFEFKKTRLILR